MKRKQTIVGERDDGKISEDILENYEIVKIALESILIMLKEKLG